MLRNFFIPPRGCCFENTKYKYEYLGIYIYKYNDIRQEENYGQITAHYQQFAVLSIYSKI